jgi:hypothetical protein
MIGPPGTGFSERSGSKSPIQKLRPSDQKPFRTCSLDGPIPVKLRTLSHPRIPHHVFQIASHLRGVEVDLAADLLGVPGVKSKNPTMTSPLLLTRVLTISVVRAVLTTLVFMETSTVPIQIQTIPMKFSLKFPVKVLLLSPFLPELPENPNLFIWSNGIILLFFIPPSFRETDFVLGATQGHS